MAEVNPEVMDLSRVLDPSGMMEEGRRQSSLNMLAYLFDGLRCYRKEQGRPMLKMTRKYIPQGCLIRVMGADGAQYVALVYDDLTVDYDVIVDEASTAPNVKQRIWGAFTRLAGQLPQVITPQVALIALDYAPFAQAMVQKLKAQAQPPAGAQPPPDPMEQAEVANLNASTRLKGAQAEKVRTQTAAA